MTLFHPTKRRARAALALGLLLLAIAVTHALWVPAIGRFLVVSDPLQPADALVALAGGDPTRADYGAALVKQGYARWFVATNMPLNFPGIRVPYSELVRREAIWQGVPEEQIVVVSPLVTTTHQEAQAVLQAMEEHRWRSLVVVTDPYHSRRARMVFRQVFRGSGIRVIVQHTDLSWCRADSWWQTPECQRLTWSEYLKLALYLVGYR